jgi:tetratricopeptide (TPR) repeat protein
MERTLKSLRRAGACLLLGLLACAPAHAVDNATTVEALKERALQAAVAADVAQRGQSCPVPGHTDLYFGGVADARAVRLSLSVDGAATLDHGFTTAEARALAQGGLFHFDCLRLASGTHHLQATLSWNAESDKTPPLQLEQDVELPAPGTLLELRLHRAPLGVGAAQLELRPRGGQPYEGASGWRALFGMAPPEETGDQFVLGGAGDPRVRQARYLIDTGHAMSAAMVLRELAAEAQGTVLAPRFPLELGQAELAYGLSAAAQASWQAAPVVAANQVQRAALSLELAQYRYERGALAAAQELLGVPQVPRGPHPDPALTARQRLYSMLLLAQGRQEPAAEVLRDTFNAADYDSWVCYYNLGVSLIQSGQAPQGLTVLNRVGSLATDSPLLRRLRDHANLVLARHFLEAGQGATAIPVFGRIDSAGPDSASALLGLGWAWLAPAGTMQPEIRLGDEIVTGAPPETPNGAMADRNDQNLYQRFHIAPFARASLPGDEADRLRRALAAWVIVADRSERDARAEEAMIDIAWALRRLGATQEAAQYDQRALAGLERERTQLDAAEAQARDAQGPDRWLAGDKAVEPGLPWDLPALPPPPATPFLLDLLAEHPFQVAMHDYRDLRLLQGGPGGEVLGADLQAALQAQRLQLRDMELDALALQRHRVEALLLNAHDALIHIYDNPDAAVQPQR